MKIYRCNRPETLLNAAKPCDCSEYSAKYSEWGCDGKYGKCKFIGIVLERNDRRQEKWISLVS
jgi:hypothetical protein